MASAAATTVIQAVPRTAALGKAALPVRRLLRVAQHVPGGQLHANLRRHDHDPSQPVTAAGIGCERARRRLSIRYLVERLLRDTASSVLPTLRICQCSQCNFIERRRIVVNTDNGCAGHGGHAIAPASPGVGDQHGRDARPAQWRSGDLWRGAGRVVAEFYRFRPPQVMMKIAQIWLLGWLATHFCTRTSATFPSTCRYRGWLRNATNQGPRTHCCRMALSFRIAACRSLWLIFRCAMIG